MKASCFLGLSEVGWVSRSLISAREINVENIRILANYIVLRILLIFIAAWGMGGWGWAAPLRVVAFNVLEGLEAANTPSFEDVARNLERIGADVVGLEEIRTFDAANFTTLRQRLGYSYSINFISSGFYHSQVLLSRYPITFKQWVWGDGMVRPIFLVQIDVPNLINDPFVAVVHLKATSNTSSQFNRAVELARLKKALLDQGVGANSNVILMGDFNHVSSADVVFNSDPDGTSGYGLVSDLPYPINAYVSTDGYFPELDIFKIELRHADGSSSYTWIGNSTYPPSTLDHIMASGPIRDLFPQSEIYDFAKDMAGLAGRPKFGDLPATGSVYSSDHLPVFADLVLRDTGDGFPNDTIAPSLGWNISSQTLIFLNQTVSSATSDVRAVDSLDFAPVVTCYPLNPTYTSAGIKKITYMARDRHGNMSITDRIVTVADWGQGGLTHNLQWPLTMQIPVNGQGTVYAQIYIPGWTETVAKVAPNVRCWIGVNGLNTDPSTWPASAWKEATLNGSQGVVTSADEYAVSLLASDTGVGTFYYASRWQINGGAYGYGGIAATGVGGSWDGATYAAGVLTVGSTFAEWSGGATLNSENLSKYAIGGGTSLTSTDGQASVVGADSDTLTLTVIVRTDDNSLTIVGEASTNLTTGWGSEVVSVANTADQSGVPTGCTRRVFSVSRGADKSKFLRLKVTKGGV